MKKITQAYGNWVTGEDYFWNREHEMAHFIEALDEGAHLYMVAQRRIGKTSLMREAARRIKDRYSCLYVDLQKAKTARDLIVELSRATHPHKSLWMKTRDVFGNILGTAADRIDSLQIDEVTVKIRDGLADGNWHVKGDRLLAALASTEKPVVILMDEVPILINRIIKGTDNKMTPDRIAAADEVLSWLRKNSIEHRGTIRFVITGSIGLEPILRQAKLSATINNFAPFNLEPWDAETAMGCLSALANKYGVEFQDGARERITECLSCCIPHHVQMFFSKIYERCKKRGDMTCEVHDVDEVYETSMLGTRGHVDLSTFEERLGMVMEKAVLPFVLELLTETAIVGHLSAEALAFYRKDHNLEDRAHKGTVREILDILEHDGYLRREPRGYVFISHFLRDWWKRRFGFGFVPAAQRVP